MRIAQRILSEIDHLPEALNGKVLPSRFIDNCNSHWRIARLVDVEWSERGLLLISLLLLQPISSIWIEPSEVVLILLSLKFGTLHLKKKLSAS